MFASQYGYTPKQVRGLTLTELFNLSSQAISKFMSEEHRSIFIPQMAENPSKTIDKQEEKIEERAFNMWDRMFPPNMEDGYPADYPDEFKKKGLNNKGDEGEY